jgi:hypothetical protein
MSSHGVLELLLRSEAGRLTICSDRAEIQGSHHVESLGLTERYDVLANIEWSAGPGVRECPFPHHATCDDGWWVLQLADGSRTGCARSVVCRGGRWCATHA